MTVCLPDALREVVAAPLPGQDLTGTLVTAGQSHTVVLLPGAAAVRIARTPAAAAELPRRTALLGRLARAGPPFDVPVPQGGVTAFAGRTAVALP
ncbi:hypothetical protein POF50_007440 [Streptomyces sp. SL13]|uniref:Uncharacterized protein n=1 Tax=Streptantibioticus silvisoli TaxID=2705255 RepID=A0AA90K7R0_9ACTN|nr:hypothetical protein [Streptantibioticus silvisoli]MDI5969178.1 hypothetical protein [Streptantibioticus silvisoli]